MRGKTAGTYARHGLFASFATCAALALTSAACARPATDPSGVLRLYARALEEGRADDAYRLLSDDARRGISQEAFRRMMKDDPEAMVEIGRSLERPTTEAVVTATITSPGGQELHLVLDGGKWRVDAATIDLYAQDTPRRAIAGFVRALEGKRYDVITRYVPEAHRSGLDASKLKAAWEGPEKDEIEQLVVVLKQALPGATIEETGDRATMPYGSGTIQLVREHGLWKIEDFM